MSEEQVEREKTQFWTIETEGESSLIEWHKIVKRGKEKIIIAQRGYVETTKLGNGFVSEDILAHAFPVGPDPKQLDLDIFTRQLRLRDVWTKADFRKKYKSVIRSLFEALEVK